MANHCAAIRRAATARLSFGQLSLEFESCARHSVSAAGLAGIARDSSGSTMSYAGDPLPQLVTDLRSALYPPLSTVANRWNVAMGIDVRYPNDHVRFLERCHKAGQTKPTPLILKYADGDYNCLHQDLYGEHVFPLQAAFLLSTPNRDFTGGEFVLTEQRPRMQSRAEVVPLDRGDGVIFAVSHRPVKGTRGYYRSSSGTA